MFKSVFTKYVTAFMIMIGISFSLLAIILSQMVSGYAQDSKSRVIERTSETLTDFITSQYREAGGDFNQFIYFDRDSVEPFISALANFNEDVSADVMSEVSFGGETTFSGDLGGVFSSKQMIHVSPITDGDGSFTGAVFVCTPSKATDQLIVSMIKTIIMASLWVMLAALISVYMISDKIITPLKEMSRAAKSFASGKFDVRVPVRGRDEVAELATGFNSMAASLANLEDMRRTFLANVSHDLRTPMTTISGFIDGILDGAIPPEKHEYYLGIIRTEIRRLSRLVISLLDITRIQAGASSTRPRSISARWRDSSSSRSSRSSRKRSSTSSSSARRTR